MTDADRHQASLMDPAEGCLGFALNKAARSVTRYYNDALAGAGMTITQFTLLTVVQRTGPTTIAAIAARTGTDATTLSRNLGILAKAGLVRMTPGEDRRERQVSSTRKGSDRLKHAHGLWQGAQGRLLKGLGESKARQVLALLSGLPGSLDSLTVTKG
ncbi:MAG: MarR family winged helix-turn-helix transcriptional regulator [Alphaproteobacteria bacterium]|nr:MarR family winged helix-turn-helix transcriptional regulator [Alphaproteobacteria bacterium]